jgi:hypothetical protein
VSSISPHRADGLPNFCLILLASTRLPPQVFEEADCAAEAAVVERFDLTGGLGVDHIPIGLNIITIARDNDANKHTFLSDLANGQKAFHLPRQYSRLAGWV